MNLLSEKIIIIIKISARRKCNIRGILPYTIPACNKVVIAHDVTFVDIISFLGESTIVLIGYRFYT